MKLRWPMRSSIPRTAPTQYRSCSISWLNSTSKRLPRGAPRPYAVRVPNTPYRVVQWTTGNVGKSSVEAIAKMYARWGVDEAKFLATMNSFGITGKLNKARQFALRTGVDSTPTIIVNGKYRVSVDATHNFDDMLRITSYLIGMERAANGGAKPAAAPAKKG